MPTPNLGADAAAAAGASAGKGMPAGKGMGAKPKQLQYTHQDTPVPIESVST